MRNVIANRVKQTQTFALRFWVLQVRFQCVDKLALSDEVLLIAQHKMNLYPAWEL